MADGDQRLQQGGGGGRAAWGVERKRKSHRCGSCKGGTVGGTEMLRMQSFQLETHATC